MTLGGKRRNPAPMDSKRFTGTVHRSYGLNGKRVIVLEGDYAGDIDRGDIVSVEGAGTGRVENVAWGSAFDAESPPLTLVVDDLMEAKPGSKVERVVDAD